MNPIAKLQGWISFALFYLGEVIKSNLMIAWDVINPRDLTRPGVIALDLPDHLNDRQIFMISSLITMTPGSLSLDLSADRRILYLHMLYLDEDVESTREHLRKNYVERVLKLG
jgi:multicomponent Na+:H+ antiporter subunit E